MLVGEIYGTTGTREFRFKAYKEVKRMDFVVVKHEGDTWLMAQIDQVESHPDGMVLCLCRIIGYRDNGMLKSPKTPIKPASLVYTADQEVIKHVLNLDTDGLYLGRLDANNDVSVFTDTKKLISKHVAVLASTGSGKSYTVGVILEELLEKNLPVLIIDPHGEYSSLKFANDNKAEIDAMERFDIAPKSYDVNEYSPDVRVNPGAQQLTFSDKNLSALELSQLFPMKASPSQMGVLYTAINEAKSRGNYTLQDIIQHASNTESSARWTVVNMLEVVKEVGLFSDDPTKVDALVQQGEATIINLRGVAPELQNVAVYKLLNDLFEARKVGRIPPLFLVVEEAHNFCPEKESRSSSKIIRTIASEGRKFGLGLCVISQRPARVDKNVLSQCNTQIILKMTNPNDLKAVSYAEGMTSEMEKEVKALNPGSAIILGHEMPLFVNIRPRRSRHGGATVTVTEQPKVSNGVLTFVGVSKDAVEKKYGAVKEVLYPCWFATVGSKHYLVDAIKGNLIYHEENRTKESQFDAEAVNKHITKLPQIKELTGDILKAALTSDQAKEKVETSVGKISALDLAYYTYYIGIGKKFMVDAVTGVKRDL